MYPINWIWRKNKMKVKELIKQLKKTNQENEVRIDFGRDEDEIEKEFSKEFYLSFDDLGDCLIYEEI